MIDTIKLTLDKAMYSVTDESKFQKGKFNAGRGFYKLVQNPTKSELKKGLYKPRLTITPRFNTTGKYRETLSIELSLPKLWFGNNFDELEVKHFEAINKSLQSKLQTMGVYVFTDVLKKAPVSAVHYSKNIPLLDGTTPRQIIAAIQQANISTALDVNQTDFRNNGYSFKYHASSYEIAFYDKVKDIQISKVSEKRALESENLLQQNIFDQFKKRNKLEILRYEVRLNTRQKIKSVFNKLDITTDICFGSVFSSSKSNKVLNYFIDHIELKRLSLFDTAAKNDKEFIAQIKFDNPDITLAALARVYGLKKIFEHYNPREYRQLADKSDRTWYRLQAEVKAVRVKTRASPLKTISNNLEEYQPFRLENYKHLMIN